MSETVNGSVGLFRSRRGGSDWQTTTIVGGGLGSNLLQPIYLADRTRDKIRFTAGWTPTAKLDLQFRADAARDEYGGRTLGVQSGSAQNYALDGAYRLSEDWSLTAWVSRDDTRAYLLRCASASSSNNGDIGSCPNTGANPIWQANLRTVGNAIGAGVNGKPTGKVELQATFQLSNDRGEFNNGPAPTGVAPPVTLVPDTKYNHSVTRLTGKYALEKKSGVRLTWIHDRFSTNDWTWGYTYADGTTVQPNSQQTVNFFGASYYYNF
jgi:hypothetical protein